MKKSLIFGAMASMMLFATSCQEDFPVVETGNEAVVSFNLSTPQIATRVYSDGTTATRLQYAVYKNVKTANGVELQYLENLTRTNEELEGRKKEVNLKLTTGDTYTVVFWASEPNAPYTVTFDAAMPTVTVDYETAKLCNDETRDAFFNDTTFTVTGSVAMEVDLRRPFAQLNIGTSDYTEAANSGYEVEKTAVKVSKVYRTLNLVENEDGTHTVTNPVQDLTFDLNDIPNEDLNADGPFPVAGYKYLSMNYLLVPDEKEVLSQVTLTYNSTDGNTKDRTFGQIPVQRNYRTNIYGQLLTSNVDVYVEIIPDYYTPDHPQTSEEDLIVAASVGGEYTMNGNVDLTETNAPFLNVTADYGFTLNIPEGVVFTTGSAANYGVIVRNGTTTINGEGDIHSEGGGFGVVGGASLIFNGGNLDINTTSTSGRYLFYAEGAGSTITINGGNFADFTQTSQNQKRAYVYASEGTTVYINGGTFGKASTRAGYTDGIMGPGTVVIKGGTFGFDPTNRVAAGYHAVKEGENWVVVPEDVDAIAHTAAAFKAALDEFNNAPEGDYTIVLADGEFADAFTVQQFVGKNLTIKAQNAGKTTLTAQSGHILYIDGNSGTAQGTLNIEGLNFEMGTGVYAIEFGSGSEDRYARNVTIENCTFNGPGYCVLSGSGSSANTIAVRNCEATDVNTFVTAYVEGLVVEDCQVAGEKGINNQGAGEGAGVTVSGSAFNLTGYGIRVNGGMVVVENSSIKTTTAEADEACIVFRASAQGAELTNTTLEGVTFYSNSGLSKSAITGAPDNAVYNGTWAE